MRETNGRGILPRAEQGHEILGQGDMEAFEYSALPARVILSDSEHSRALPTMLNALGRKRAFVLSGSASPQPPVQRGLCVPLGKLVPTLFD